MLVDNLIFSDWVDDLVFSNEKERTDARKRRRTLTNRGTIWRRTLTDKGMIWRRGEERWRTEERFDEETRDRGRTLELRLDSRKSVGSDLHKEERWVLKRMQGRKSETWVFKARVLKMKLEFHVDFLPHQLPPLTNRDLKTQVLSWNLNFRHSRY